MRTLRPQALKWACSARIIVRKCERLLAVLTRGSCPLPLSKILTEIKVVNSLMRIVIIIFFLRDFLILYDYSMTEFQHFASLFVFLFHSVPKALIVNGRKWKFFLCRAGLNRPKMHSRFPLVVERQGVAPNGDFPDAQVFDCERLTLLLKLQSNRSLVSLLQESSKSHGFLRCQLQRKRKEL